jgi:4-oxalocrotonate tautomerase
MPIVTVSMYSDRIQREKDRVAEAITEDIAKILNLRKKK